MVLGETQRGVNKRLETKVLDTGSIKTEQDRALLLRGNMTLPYSISGVTNPLENHSCSMILPHCSINVITTDITTVD